MEREQFEKLVEEALASLPQKFKELIHNVAVIVEDLPTKETRRTIGVPSRSNILGLYHGVPYTHRGPYYGNVPPDVIIIYQQPIERICRSDDEIKERIQEVVVHEVGHYFGLSDDELRDIEFQIKKRGKLEEI
jgi:predicted Zn-dependent protease with MMP-like domain